MQHDEQPSCQGLRRGADRRAICSVGDLFVLGLTGIGTGMGTHVAPALPGGARPLYQIVAEFERTVLEDALRQCRGDVVAVQQMLQTPRKTLYDKLAKHGLKPAHYR